MDSDAVVTAEIDHTDEGDPSTLLPILVGVQVGMTPAGIEAEFKDAALMGYHKSISEPRWSIRARSHSGRGIVRMATGCWQTRAN